MKKTLRKRAPQMSSAEAVWLTGWTYIRHVVDTAREPFLLLDQDLRILSANEAFYRTFHVIAKHVEGKLVYKLGKGQWNIPALRRLLEEILPKETFFKDFEVDHEYPIVGKKSILMNARQVFDPTAKGDERKRPKLIILAMEDVTRQRMLEQKLKAYSKELAERVNTRTKELEERLEKLEARSKRGRKPKIAG